MVGKKEISQVLEVFDQVMLGNKSWLLVAGYSGVGKTVLVQEMYKPITKSKGYYAAGKFDQFKRNIPYSALLQAVNGLLDQILVEDQVSFQMWKSKLEEALGDRAGLFTDLLPSLELILGPQPPLTDLPPTEASIRFMDGFLAIIRTFANSDHPLVLFIDDMQWSDTSSLEIIGAILDDAEISHLLLIGAYRNNEVDESHPFIQKRDQLAKKNIPITEISLQPLHQDDLNQLILDTLKGDPIQCAGLGQLIFEKTKRESFFCESILNQNSSGWISSVGPYPYEVAVGTGCN